MRFMTFANVIWNILESQH